MNEELNLSTIVNPGILGIPAAGDSGSTPLPVDVLDMAPAKNILASAGISLDQGQLQVHADDLDTFLDDLGSEANAELPDLLSGRGTGTDNIVGIARHLYARYPQAPQLRALASALIKCGHARPEDFVPDFRIAPRGEPLAQGGLVLASSLVRADLHVENIFGMEVIFTPAMRAEVTVNGKVQTVDVAAQGMTADKISNAIFNQYIQAMGEITGGIIGFAADGTAVLLARLAATAPQTPLDPSVFAAEFALQTGGKIMSWCERVSVVPPPGRVMQISGMTQARADIFMRDDHPAPCVSWYDALGFFAWLTEMTGWQWGFPDEIAHQATGLAGRNPRLCKYPTASGTEDELAAEAHYGQAWEEGTTVANRSFPPTPWGHYDMAGNLWEWMLDLWNSAQTNRVLRAGSWFNGPDDQLALSRSLNHPDYRYRGFGLRGCVWPRTQDL